MPQGDKPEVILHIGGSKCGSSAIQAYLQQNADALRDNGVVVPGQRLDLDSPVTGEQIWRFEEAATSGQLQALAGKVRLLIGKARETGARAIVLSAENICNHPQLAPALADALSDVQVRIVLYVRRQDDFLISSWQQWHLKRFASIEAFLSDRVGSVACWTSIVAPWVDAFGKECLVVRPFVRDRLENRDVVDDFFHQTGLSQDGLAPLAQAANPSFDDALARLAHRVRDVFEDQHDNRFYEVMVRLLGRDALKSGSASSLLDLETRRRIWKRYEVENEALKAQFMPELGDQPLFEPPTRGDVADLSEARKLNDDIAMLTRCIYALAARSEDAA